jgi:hypothetical protein
MTLYSEYREWPATQRMRPARLARRVKSLQHRQPRGEPRSQGQTDPGEVNRPPSVFESLLISSMLKNFHEMFGLDASHEDMVQRARIIQSRSSGHEAPVSGQGFYVKYDANLHPLFPHSR